MKVAVCIPSVAILYLISNATLNDLTTGTRGYHPRVAGTRRLKNARIRVWVWDIVAGTRYPPVIPVLCLNDESTVHANDYQSDYWLKEGEQILKKKDCGRLIMMSEYICV